MVIVLAGFGNMGRALATGWLEANSIDGRITVLDPDAEARHRAQKLGLISVAKAADISAAIDIVVLAVKPAEIDALLGELPQAKLYVSIAAGRTIGSIAALVDDRAAIVRAMPNTPAAIGCGVTGLCANANVSAGDKAMADALLGAVGSVEWLDNESEMDALTAVSGSGPAYVFLLIECLTAAAIEVGLEPGLAERLATATVRGAGAYAAASDADAATLRRQVTSPQGTTAAALEVLLAEDALSGLIAKAVRAATKRSRELGSTASI
jgi:pyrroline-5-carboxylate reductase